MIEENNIIYSLVIIILVENVSEVFFLFIWGRGIIFFFFIKFLNKRKYSIINYGWIVVFYMEGVVWF